jgi:hypothetical protein
MLIVIGAVVLVAIWFAVSHPELIPAGYACIDPEKPAGESGRSLPASLNVTG